MEVKILLRLIKEDVTHLERITTEFVPESIAFSDEIDLALVRAKALVQELELLHKTVAQSESGVMHMKSVPHTKEAASELIPAEPKSSEDFGEEIRQERPFLQDEKEPEPSEEIEITAIEEVHIPLDSGNPETVKFAKTTEDVNEAPVEIADESDRTGDETLVESQQMVNEILSSGKSESGYKIIPINNIRDGIGINDRFLFVRELFGDNQQKFETAVEQLDHLSTIQDAVNYLKANFKWNKSEASQKFLALVKRRFTN